MPNYYKFTVSGSWICNPWKNLDFGKYLHGFNYSILTASSIWLILIYTIIWTELLKQCDCTAWRQVSSGSGDIQEFRKARLERAFFCLCFSSQVESSFRSAAYMRSQRIGSCACEAGMWHADHLVCRRSERPSSANLSLLPEWYRNRPRIRLYPRPDSLAQ